MQVIRLALVLAAALSTRAQQQPGDKHFVRASADAKITAQPDRAFFSLGVQTQASTAKSAAEQNAAQTTRVLKTMKALLGSKGRIQTSGYSISPHYETINNSNRQNGFEGNNSVEVTVDDLSLLPQLIDAAAGSGANNISGISFSLKDDSAFRLQALGEASRKAKASAEAIAQSLSLHVTGIANAESAGSSQSIRPKTMNGAMFERMAAAVPTPIESGDIEIFASVTVTLEVSP